MATYTDNGTNTPNGVHKEFSYAFPILKNEDLKVSINSKTIFLASIFIILFFLVLYF